MNIAAPDDCLQYFTGTSGKVWSFNWIDTAWTAPRQLANQDYKACFRSEQFGDRVSAAIDCYNSQTREVKHFYSVQVATTICYKVCKTLNGGNPFSVSGSNNGFPLTSPHLLSQPSNGNILVCKYDFVGILGGVGDAAADFGDRFCGGKMNADTAQGNKAFSQTICSEQTLINRGDSLGFHVHQLLCFRPGETFSARLPHGRLRNLPS